MGMGYQGFARFYMSGPSTTPVVVLATGASVNLVLEPIFSNAVWGAGWYNAATSAHYADNAIRFEGNVDFELQGGMAIWNFMRDWIVEQRAYPRSLEISPDGARVYKYLTSSTYNNNYDLNGAWCTSASFSTSEGSFVTVSAGVIALNRSETDPANGTNFSNYSYIKQRTGVVAGNCTTGLSPTNPLNPAGSNVNPIPYWRTNAELLTGTYSKFTGGSVPQSGLETVEWSTDVSNNHVVLYTCNGNRLPTALLQGPMDVSGSVILYNENSVFDPIFGPANTGTITSPFMYAENTWFRVTIARGALSNIFIEVPAVVVESDDFSIQGQDSVTNRTFSIKGLGGRCDSTNLTSTLPPFIMSQALD